MSDRLVLVRVTDPDVTYIRVKEDGPGGGHRGKYRESYDILGGIEVSIESPTTFPFPRMTNSGITSKRRC